MKMLSGILLLFACSGLVLAHGVGVDHTNHSVRNSSIHKPEKLQTTNQSKDTAVRRAVQQAQQFILKARQTADQNMIDKAEAIVRPWEKDAGYYPEIALVIVQIKLFNHQFAEAQNMLDTLITGYPQQQQAVISRAMLHYLQGQYREALSDCKLLIRQSQVTLGTICSLVTSSMNGKLKESFQALNLFTRHLQTFPESIQVWVLVSLADMAERLDLAEKAEKYYLQALAFDSIDQSVRESYAEYLLRQGKMETLLDFAENAPQSDGLLLRIGSVQRNTDKAQWRKLVAILNNRLYGNNQHARQQHLREQAYFRLHVLSDAASALPLARKNWQLQREPVDLLLYLNSASAVNHTNDLIKIKEWISATGYQDERVREFLQL